MIEKSAALMVSSWDVDTILICQGAKSLSEKHNMPRSRGFSDSGSGGVMLGWVDESRHLDHALPYSSYASASSFECRAISRRVSRDRSRAEVVASGMGVEGRSSGRISPMSRQIELADDFRPEQRNDVRADGETEAWKDFFRDSRSADEVPAFEHQHLATGARKVGGGSEPVMPPSDDNRVISQRRRL